MPGKLSKFHKMGIAIIVTGKQDYKTRKAFVSVSQNDQQQPLESPRSPSLEAARLYSQRVGGNEGQLGERVSTIFPVTSPFFCEALFPGRGARESGGEDLGSCSKFPADVPGAWDWPPLHAPQGGLGSRACF